MKNEEIDRKEKELFARLQPNYSRSKADVWEVISGQIAERQPAAKQVSFTPVRWMQWSVAAAVVMALAFGLFARLYTTTVSLEAGAQASHTLPDGSVVHLNAASELAYAPYWWAFDRNVSLEGEAFFEVKKGEKFRVVSAEGTTEVLGTSFNVYARNGEYSVYCKTGKVRVSNANEVILLPGELAFRQADGTMERKQAVNEEAIMAWRLQKFLYNATPLAKVLADLERHYHIRLKTELPGIDSLHYTGLFDRSVTAEEALQIISVSFDLAVEKEAEDLFVIKPL